MKICRILAVALFALIVCVCLSEKKQIGLCQLSDLELSNVEAIASGEGSTFCSNGCSDIGWGMNKILECDCNYDHFSSCERWGC
jgi:hypothetical protein